MSVKLSEQFTLRLAEMKEILAILALFDLFEAFDTSCRESRIDGRLNFLQFCFEEFDLGKSTSYRILRRSWSRNLLRPEQNAILHVLQHNFNNLLRRWFLINHNRIGEE